MEFLDIITTFIQRARDELSFRSGRNLFPQKWAKVHPINNKHDIETGLYHGEDMCRITVHYSSLEECKWDAGQIL
jgi:hypothetical protein